MIHARHTVDADVRPGFTACYLRVAGAECAFIEAHTAHALPKLLSALAAHGKRPEDVRWVVVTHAHLDHAAGAGALLDACPNAKLVAHPRAAKNLVDPGKLVKGAKLVYGVERFASLYGEVKPIPEARVVVLEDGESVELGDAKLTAFHTAGHAFHHFIVDDSAMDTVFTGDTFGLVYPGLQRHGRFAIPSTSPTGFEANEAKKSIEKVLSLGRRRVCPTHFDTWEDVAAIGAQVRRFVEHAGAWVEEAARGDETVEAMQRRFERAWRDLIAQEAPRFGAEEWELLALDVELNAQGLAFAADAKRSS
jgi:glyoxylase-like metal-dependent hydrolase (beta-lactamase superfamily II)